MFTVLNLLITVVLFVAMLALQELGRRIADREWRVHGDSHNVGTGAAEGAVYALLGLFLAFAFSGAGARYEARRHLIVDEANAIGTAWLRLDLLPSNSQPDLRNLFRQYVDARIKNARAPTADPEITATVAALQRQIWSHAVDAARVSGQVPPFTVVLPALNEMIDITTTREEAKQRHSPTAVFVMLGILALIGSVFAGYSMAGGPRRWLHLIGFAAVLATALFVIVDFEFPRLGLIRIDTANSVLIDLRRSMN